MRERERDRERESERARGTVGVFFSKYAREVERLLESI